MKTKSLSELKAKLGSANFISNVEAIKGGALNDCHSANGHSAGDGHSAAPSGPKGASYSPSSSYPR